MSEMLHTWSYEEHTRNKENSGTFVITEANFNRYMLVRENILHKRYVSQTKNSEKYFPSDYARLLIKTDPRANGAFYNPLEILLK